MRPLPTHLQIFTTEDGSPTLAHRRADGYTEKMHHSRGALSESVFIYQDALLQALERALPVRILSFGLGLGYNELLSLATLHMHGVRDFQIWSFESQEILRKEFHSWAMQDTAESALQEVLNEVCLLVSSHMEVSPEQVKGWTREALTRGALELRGPFPVDAGGVRECTLVYFDAFSNKMDPEPWQEDLLIHKVGPCLSARAIVATYAATGSLNRGLRALGFRLLPKSGFSRKRGSTLAIRGDFR